VRNQNTQGEDEGKLRDLALLFSKLGFVAFGGPAAHIAMMHAEIVRRRRWMDEQEFLDLMGARTSSPAPTPPSSRSTSAGFGPAGGACW
jgi:chromate transporter